MNIRRFRSLGRTLELRDSRSRPTVPAEAHLYSGHAHFWERALSRRNFFATAAGVTGVALASSGLALPALGDDDDREGNKSGSPSPKPIPGGAQFLAPGSTEVFHVGDPSLGEDPSTITDFKGSVGVAFLHGTGTGTDDKGKATKLPFEADMRFMTGKYIGEDGREHRGTFALVWLDLFVGSLDGPQIHDFNYGISSTGLFWTALIPPDSVDVELEDGEAQLVLGNSFLIDAHDFDNSLKRGSVSPASASFKVHWHNPNTRRDHIRDSTNRFDLEFVQTSAALEWSAVEKGFRYDSDAAATSVTEFAEVGRERNGVFFEREG